LKQHKQLTVKIADLKGLEKNARLHSDAQIQQIQKSIERFGFLSPVVIDKKGTVIAGNGRLQAAKNLGLKEVPAIEAEGLSEADLRAYALVDNRLSETSEWDKEILKHELDDLMLNLEMDLETVGFSPDEIMALTFTGWVDTGTTPDEEPEQNDRPKKEITCPHCKKTFEV
jgi:ParB-like chromosome segregation protein Spo0J